MKSRPNAIIDKESGKIIVQRPMPPINCLAFEGGGSRCAAYPGFYKILILSGLINDVRYVSGSSGGAICALAVALGFDPEEAEKIMLGLNMEKFLEGYHTLLASGGIWSLLKTSFAVWKSTTASLSSGAELLAWIEGIVEKQFGNRKATFRDLEAKITEQQLTGGNKFKKLYITATDLSIAIPECKTLCFETEPDMPLALAALASAAFPFALRPVEWKGHLLSDGGLIRNLPTKVFDAVRFLPQGYGFTDKGVNPGVLSIKVDSRDEMNQVLYGVLKEVDLKTASDVVASVLAALWQNTDPQEIREARMAIVLPDNNIGALEFSVNDAGKIDLISAAENETRNFVENYYHTAYEVATYPNVLAWLDSLTLDQIDDVLIAYNELRQDLLKEAVLTQQLLPVVSGEFDPNAPTDTEILNYQVYIEDYFQHRRQMRRRVDAGEIRELPRYHVNLKPQMKHDAWSDLIHRDMTKKLKYVRARLDYVRDRIEAISCEFTDFPTVTSLTCLHDENHFENIQALTGLSEYYKILFEEKKELKLKLGIYKPKNYNYPREQSVQYAEFLTMMNPMLRSASLAPEVKAVIFEQFPIALFESSGYTRKAIFMCDLHDVNDRRLYVIAALHFLTAHARKCKEMEIFNQVYRKFVSEAIALPINFQMLGQVLGKDGVDLMVDAYRIEELLHYFERTLNPKSKSSIMLDTIFGVDKLLKTKKVAVKEGEDAAIGMKHMVSTASIFSSQAQSLRRTESGKISKSGLTSAAEASRSLEKSRSVVLKPDDAIDDVAEDRKPKWFYQ